METVQLPVTQRAAAALGTKDYEKNLLTLAVKHSCITAITNDAGYRDCHSARVELKNVRVELEKRGKAAREDAQTFSKAVIAEEKRLIALIEPEEQRLKKLQDDWDAVLDAKRQAAIRIEQERLAAIERAKKEAEEKALAEQRAEIERQRAELSKQQAEQRAAEEKARREREEADRQARMKIETEERAARQRIEEEERKARAARQVEEDRLRAERKQLEDEQRVRDAEKRLQQEETEARERESLRLQNEFADARAMLETFRKRFGHRPEFALVLEAIEECLAEAA